MTLLFRLCRSSVQTSNKVEFDSLSWSTLSPSWTCSTRSTLLKAGDFCRPNVKERPSDICRLRDICRLCWIRQSRPSRIRLYSQCVPGLTGLFMCKGSEFWVFSLTVLRHFNAGHTTMFSTLGGNNYFLVTDIIQQSQGSVWAKPFSETVLV